MVSPFSTDSGSAEAEAAFVETSSSSAVGASMLDAVGLPRLVRRGVAILRPGVVGSIAFEGEADRSERFRDTLGSAVGGGEAVPFADSCAGSSTSMVGCSISGSCAEGTSKIGGDLAFLEASCVPCAISVESRRTSTQSRMLYSSASSKAVYVSVNARAHYTEAHSKTDQ